jgi:hypothetical protein
MGLNAKPLADADIQGGRSQIAAAEAVVWGLRLARAHT